ncbi:MAG: hypothetical protein V7693_16270 [Halopseudomonas sabulinigri]
MSKDIDNKDEEFEFNIDNSGLIEEMINDSEKNQADSSSSDPFLEKNDGLSLEDDSSSSDESQKTSVLKISIIAFLVFLVLIAGLGWVALRVLGTNNTNTQGASGFDQSNMSAPNQMQTPSATNDNAQDVRVESAFGDNQTPANFNERVSDADWGSDVNNIKQSEFQQNEDFSGGVPVSNNDVADAIVIRSGTETLSDTENSIAANNVNNELSEEELLYDKLLDQTEELDVVPEGLVIDESVVRRQVSDKRMSVLESEVSSTRQTIGTLRVTLGAVQEQVKDMADVISKSSTEQSELRKSIQSIGSAVDEMSKEQSNLMIDLNKKIELVTSIATVAQQDAKSAKDISLSSASVARRSSPEARPQAVPSKPVVDVQPVREPEPEPVVAAAKPARPAPVTRPVEAPQPVKPTEISSTARRSSQVSETNQANGCSSQTVSAIWRVKGVNTTSAYVTRAQDRTGIILRKGVQVPGFGNVVSFNSDARSVCTTAGLIQR